MNDEPTPDVADLKKQIRDLCDQYDRTIYELKLREAETKNKIQVAIAYLKCGACEAAAKILESM